MKINSLPPVNTTFRDQSGFSLIEILIVVVVGAIIAGAALLSFSVPKKYAADDQSLLILDVVQEARQRAINQKSTMRMEFNDTAKQIRLIDENKAGDTSDDAVIRNVQINTANVIVGTHPLNVNITNVPQESSPVAEAVFGASNYPSSLSQSVFTLCFVKDGRVVQVSADGTCAGTNTPRGATVYVYSKTTDAAGKSMLVRAVTINGVTSAGSVYKCVTDSTNNCTAWKK